MTYDDGKDILNYINNIGISIHKVALMVFKALSRNWIGLCLLVCTISSIAACLIGSIQSFDIPYINCILFFSFWTLYFYLIISFDIKFRIKIIVLLLIIIAFGIFFIMLFGSKMNIDGIEIERIEIVKQWLMYGSFYIFTVGTSNNSMDYVTSGKYINSFRTIFWFLLLSFALFLFINDRDDLEKQNRELMKTKKELEDKNNQIKEQNEELAAQQNELELHRDELEAQNSELQEKNNKLTRFSLVYNRMMSDVKKTAKYDPIQNLQAMEFSWRDFINTQIRSGRHSLRNSITGRVASVEELKEFEDELYNAVINPTVDKIISQLNKTVNMIDTEPTLQTTKHIYDEICNHISDNHFKSRVEKEHISVYTKYAISFPYICSINLHRLKAIMENLCFNTKNAFSSRRDELDDENDDEAIKTYNVSVNISFSIAVRHGREFLLIDYRDNAKGFPDKLLDKLYHAPVPSTRGVSRKGEGTMYISFFVEDMGGFVEAENQIDNYGRKCAVTKIYIPTEINKEE